MNKRTTLLMTSLTGALALASAACPPPKPLVSGSGGSGGKVFPLESTATGYVDDPVTGVVGAWFAYGDSVGSNAGVGDAGTAFADSDCAKAGFTTSQCSVITAPIPGMSFAPTNVTTSSQCTSGTAAQVLTASGGTSPDYSAIWGAGIGLDFANPGGDSGPAGYFDLSPYTGIEFDFTASELPGAGKAMRVNFPFKTMHDTDSPYWGGATTAYSMLTGTTGMPQHVQIPWTSVSGPRYLTQQTPAVTPPQFDDTAVQGIQFQVFTNSTASTPYAFCVANLALYQ